MILQSYKNIDCINFQPLFLLQNGMSKIAFIIPAIHFQAINKILLLVLAQYQISL